MDDLPHSYRIAVAAGPQGPVTVSADGLPVVRTGPPPQFGGDGGQWSPETLLMAAVGDCFCLGFRAIAQASRFDWQELECDVTGTLEKTAEGMRFTKIVVAARLVVADSGASAKAEKLLEKAEAACLVSNSLNSEVVLQTAVSAS